MSPNLLGIVSITVLAPAIALWFYRIKTVSIPDNRSAFVAAFVVGGLLGAAALYLGPPDWPIRATLWVTTSLGLFLPFSVSVSAQKTGGSAIRVGQSLPAFTAVDEDSAIFDSESLFGHPVLIKFFRGHW